MEKAIGLIGLAPLIAGIDNWVSGFIRETLLSALDRLPSEEWVLEETDDVFVYLRTHRSPAKNQFGGNEPLYPDEELPTEGETPLELAWRLLTHPAIREIEEGGLAELRAAVLTMQTSKDPTDLTDAAYDLVDACYVFGDHFYKRLPDHLLGQWGGELFRYLLDVEDSRELWRFVRSFGAEQSPAKDLSIDHNVKVDEGAFTVQMGKRRPCPLGNSRQFKLLAHLVARPFRYISFEDLAAVLGGDELDRDAVIVAKHRLCKRLTRDGYDDLAKMIHSQPSHYAFWPA